jgi:WD40 repeat protein
MELEIIDNAELVGHSGPIYALSAGFLPNTFFSGSSDRFVAEWDLVQMQQTKLAIKLEHPVYSICCVKSNENSKEGMLVIGNGNGGIHLVDLAEKKELKLLQLHNGPIFDLKYCPIKHCIFSASSDGHIARIDLSDFKSIIKKVCTQKVRQICINNSGSNIAVAAGDCSVRMLDADSLSEIHTISAHEGSANSVAFHPSGELLISGGKDAHLNIWNANNYQLIKSIPAHNYAIYGIEFNPEGTIMATASRDKTVKLWDAENFTVLKRLDRKSGGHMHSVNRIHWNYNGILISGGDDRKLMAWEVNTF